MPGEWSNQKLKEPDGKRITRWVRSEILHWLAVGAEDVGKHKS